MTEDPRISEIRAVLEKYEVLGAPFARGGLRKIGAILDRPVQIRVFRYIKSNFKPVELLPIYRVYPGGRVTRQESGGVELNAGDALGYLEEQVQSGRMTEIAERAEEVQP
jgi:hypothetical protein